MRKRPPVRNPVPNSIDKCHSGISGLDEVCNGGFPKGRPVLICGSAGCGKTLMGIQFLVKGITDYNEPGVFMSFEESAHDLTQNVISLGFDLEKLQKQKKPSQPRLRKRNLRPQPKKWSSASRQRARKL